MYNLHIFAIFLHCIYGKEEFLFFCPLQSVELMWGNFFFLHVHIGNVHDMSDLMETQNYRFTKALGGLTFV
jgi:hypothetical protein